MAKTYKCAVVESKHSLVIKEREIPKPGKGQVLIKVEACAVCRGDHLTFDAMYPRLTLPRVPGHEIVGRVAETGEGVDEKWNKQRVGVGWHAAHCFQCDACKEEDFICCEKDMVTGIHTDGGYAEYTVANQEALIRIAEEWKAEEAAPLLCAGVSVWNSLQAQGVKKGDNVVILGVGGLGHLGVQFSVKMGYNTIAVSKTNEKKDFAMKEMGAQHFIATDDVKSIAEEITKLGGARAILATIPDSKLMSDVIPALKRNGVLIVLGADFKPIQVSPLAIIGKRARIQGWPSGGPSDIEGTLAFALKSGVKPLVETFKLEDAAKAYAQMDTNKARFRAVIVM